MTEGVESVSSAVPSVSVVIAAYNASRTLPQTLKSLRAQTLREFDAVIVDDGSTDETAAIAASTGDDRIKVVTQRNAGVSAARNRGAAETRGEFLSFLDADDLWTPDKLASQLAALRASPDAGLVYSGTRSIDSEGEPLP